MSRLLASQKPLKLDDIQEESAQFTSNVLPPRTSYPLRDIKYELSRVFFSFLWTRGAIRLKMCQR